MKHDSFIKKAQKEADCETEVLWYVKEYDSHPWLRFIMMFFSDMDFAFPAGFNKPEMTQVLLLTVFVEEYDIEQGILPGTYRVKTEKFGYLDEIEDVDAYITHLITVMILAYYEANAEGKIAKLERVFQDEVRRWNWHAYVKQEQVMQILDEKLDEASEKANVIKGMLPEIIHDYYKRIDRKRLENLDRFFEKSEEILESAEDQKAHARFFMKLLSEAKNGGENINSFKDLIPHYSGVKFN